MDTVYEQEYHQVEEKHWWFVSRRNFIGDLISTLELPQSANLIDIGCSIGLLLSAIKNRFSYTVYGIDISSAAIQKAQARGLTQVLVRDAVVTEFTNNMFDCVIASDVLEHMKDDRAALQEWFRILKPGGKALLFVPAFSVLWSMHDDVNGHIRRYSKQSFREVLQKAGFTIERISYWNFFLFLPILFVRIIQNIRLKSSQQEEYLRVPAPFINRALASLLSLEALLLKAINFPFGVSLFAVCRKPL